METWTTDFQRLFTEYSPSNLCLPKFHIWCHHTIQAIREFGVMNGYTTETYETLHKKWVKNPYRISNKCNITEQILSMVYLIVQ